MLDPDRKTSLSTGYVAQAVGLPVGTFQVKVGGQTEPVTVQEEF